MHADQEYIKTLEPLPQPIPLGLRFDDVLNQQIVARQCQCGQAIEKSFKDSRAHLSPLECTLLELLLGQTGELKKKKSSENCKNGSSICV
jgi:hypothetical protein